ncbi:DUF6207 family protein [Streptomyces umbrinus]|uniref:DUF6207 family protein n=1 Tax=Streptomyces umbrinus TaxID=67370 RepID=UPI003C2F5A12
MDPRPPLPSRPASVCRDPFPSRPGESHCYAVGRPGVRLRCYLDVRQELNS